MKKVTTIVTLDNYQLKCTFANGANKIADLSSFLNTQAFLPIKQPAAFKQVCNRNYFVEWPAYELDISADTLWHIGVDEIE